MPRNTPQVTTIVLLCRLSDKKPVLLKNLIQCTSKNHQQTTMLPWLLRAVLAQNVDPQQRPQFVTKIIELWLWIKALVRYQGRRTKRVVIHDQWHQYWCQKIEIIAAQLRLRKKLIKSISCSKHWEEPLHHALVWLTLMWEVTPAQLLFLNTPSSSNINRGRRITREPNYSNSRRKGCLISRQDHRLPWSPILYHTDVQSHL